MHCERCEQSAVMHITLAGKGMVASQFHLCEECAGKYLASPPPGPEKMSQPLPNAAGEVQIEVDKVIISEIHDKQVIMLREVQGSRVFPLVTGMFEATTVNRILMNVPSPRPLTHDAWLASTEALGAKVESACIHDLHDFIYLTDLRLVQGSKKVTVDLRPSDALVVALKTGAPFLVTERLLSQPRENQSP